MTEPTNPLKRASRLGLTLGRRSFARIISNQRRVLSLYYRNGPTRLLAVAKRILLLRCRWILSSFKLSRKRFGPSQNGRTRATVTLCKDLLRLRPTFLVTFQFTRGASVMSPQGQKSAFSHLNSMRRITLFVSFVACTILHLVISLRCNDTTMHPMRYATYGVSRDVPTAYFRQEFTRLQVQF